jgi:hypothetical protein
MEKIAVILRQGKKEYNNSIYAVFPEMPDSMYNPCMETWIIECSWNVNTEVPIDGKHSYSHFHSGISLYHYNSDTKPLRGASLEWAKKLLIRYWNGEFFGDTENAYEAVFFLKRTSKIHQKFLDAYYGFFKEGK